MAMNQNAKDIILLSLLVGQAGLLGYKVSKLVTRYQLKKKLAKDIEVYGKLEKEYDQKWDERAKNVQDNGEDHFEQENYQLYRLGRIDRDMNQYYNGVKQQSERILKYVDDVTMV